VRTEGENVFSNFVVLAFIMTFHVRFPFSHFIFPDYGSRSSQAAKQIDQAQARGLTHKEMNGEKAKEILGKVARNPLRYLIDLRALLKGCFYIAYFRIFNPRIRIRFPFFVYYKVNISGPGSVLLDANCSVHKNLFLGLSIVTLSPSAKVNIGKHCALGGLRIVCSDGVEIGERTMVGFSLVQDCLFSHTAKTKDRSDLSDILKPELIKIGKNVWLGGRSCILVGTVVGDDSVISIGSVSYKSKIQDYCLACGNPIMRPSPISQRLSLRRTT
jgi:acetyltransferase-like isoleucine patch superfamily enzyme